MRDKYDSNVVSKMRNSLIKRKETERQRERKRARGAARGDLAGAAVFASVNRRKLQCY